MLLLSEFAFFCVQSIYGQNETPRPEGVALVGAGEKVRGVASETFVAQKVGEFLACETERDES